ncbi:hypothetical protein SOVF_162060 [Spinacia oleracea]|nr:hypothetical protein SOVF_162060 [Spinacia oleracea]
MENTKRCAIILFLFFTAISASTGKHHQHFVLVHGSCLGAWSWYKLVPLLKSAGNMVTVIDLAASGINLVQARDVRSFSDYTQPLMDLMKDIPSHQKVILVGHSYGGAVISQAMEHFPEKVSVGVFLTAGMAGPSLNYSVIDKKTISRLANVLDNKFTYGNGPNHPPTTFIFGPKFLSQVVFQYSPPEDAALATALVRPKPLVWSNDKYESVEHRVKVNPEKERLSIPFFFNPSHYVMVKPLNELIDKQNPAKYREYNYGKFYATRRLSSDFKKLNVENV